MSAITTCTKCGSLYEESSEEQANAPDRECTKCYLAACGKSDGKPDEMDLAKWDSLVEAARSVA